MISILLAPSIAASKMAATVSIGRSIGQLVNATPEKKNSKVCLTNQAA
jgi:hypothetical protein